MNSRIYYSDRLRRYADEHIEIPFRQIQEQSLSEADKDAVPVLVDEYGRMYLRERYTMSIRIPLCSRLQAAAWASQFGKLQTWRHGGVFCACVLGHAYVWGPTLEASCLLAGLQVLREHSILCLNKKSNELVN